jgi:drug/metabolite transporter (DMT)-like permease
VNARERAVRWSVVDAAPAPVRDERRSAALLLIAVTVVWGSVGTIVRQVPLPAAAVAAGRVWIATAVLAAVVGTGRVPGPRLFSVMRGRLVTVGAILAVHWWALFAAYQRMPVARVVFIVYAAPVLREPLERRAMSALAVAAGGFVLLARPTGHGTTSATGFALAVFAAATFAVMVLLSKPVARAYGGVRMTLGQLLVAGVVLVPIAAAEPWGSPRLRWWWLVVLGVVHTAAALAGYATALARLPVARVGTLSYVEPVSAAVCAWIVLGERPTIATAVGGALVLVAGLLVVTDRAVRATVSEVTS